MEATINNYDQNKETTVNQEKQRSLRKWIGGITSNIASFISRFVQKNPTETINEDPFVVMDRNDAVQNAKYGIRIDPLKSDMDEIEARKIANFEAEQKRKYEAKGGIFSFESMRSFIFAGLYLVSPTLNIGSTFNTESNTRNNIANINKANIQNYATPIAAFDALKETAIGQETFMVNGVTITVECDQEVGIKDKDLFIRMVKTEQANKQNAYKSAMVEASKQSPDIISQIGNLISEAVVPSAQAAEEIPVVTKQQDTKNQTSPQISTAIIPETKLKLPESETQTPQSTQPPISKLELLKLQAQSDSQNAEERRQELFNLNNQEAERIYEERRVQQDQPVAQQINNQEPQPAKRLSILEEMMAKYKTSPEVVKRIAETNIERIKPNQATNTASNPTVVQKSSNQNISPETVTTNQVRKTLQQTKDQNNQPITQQTIVQTNKSDSKPKTTNELNIKTGQPVSEIYKLLELKGISVDTLFIRGDKNGNATPKTLQVIDYYLTNPEAFSKDRTVGSSPASIINNSNIQPQIITLEQKQAILNTTPASKRNEISAKIESGDFSPATLKAYALDLANQQNSENIIDSALKSGNLSTIQVKDPEKLKILLQRLQPLLGKNGQFTNKEQAIQVAKEFLNQYPGSVAPDLSKAVYQGFLSKEGQKAYDELTKNQSLDPNQAWNILINKNDANLFKTPQKALDYYKEASHSLSFKIQEAFSTYRSADASGNLINTGREWNVFASTGFSNTNLNLSGLDALFAPKGLDGTTPTVGISATYSPPDGNFTYTGVNNFGDSVLLMQNTSFSASFEKNQGPTLTNIDTGIVSVNPSKLRFIAAASLISAPGLQLANSQGQNSNPGSNSFEVKSQIIATNTGTPGQNTVTINGQNISPSNTNFNLNPDSSTFIVQGFTGNFAPFNPNPITGQVTLNPQVFDDSGVSKFIGINPALPIIYKELPIGAKAVLGGGVPNTPLGRLYGILGAQNDPSGKGGPDQSVSSTFVFPNFGSQSIQVPFNNLSTVKNGDLYTIGATEKSTLRTVNQNEHLIRDYGSDRNENITEPEKDKITLDQRIARANFTLNSDSLSTSLLNSLPGAIGAIGLLSGYARNDELAQKLRATDRASINGTGLTGLSQSAGGDFLNKDGSVDTIATNQAEKAIATATSVLNVQNLNLGRVQSEATRPTKNNNYTTNAQSFTYGVFTLDRYVQGGFSNLKPLGPATYFISNLNESGTSGTGSKATFELNQTVNGVPVSITNNAIPFANVYQGDIGEIQNFRSTGQTIQGVFKTAGIGAAYSNVRLANNILKDAVTIQGGLEINPNALGSNYGLNRKLDFNNGGNNFANLYLSGSALTTLAANPSNPNQAWTLNGNFYFNTEETKANPNQVTIGTKYSTNIGNMRFDPNLNLSFVPSRNYPLIGSIGLPLTIPLSDSLNVQLRPGYTFPGGPSVDLSVSTPTVRVGAFLRTGANISAFDYRPEGSAIGANLTIKLSPSSSIEGQYFNVNTGYTNQSVGTIKFTTNF